MRFLKKIFICLTLVILIPLLYLTLGEKKPVKDMTWGVGFSKSYAQSFGLDWKSAYLAILDDLNTSHLRFTSYWSEIESTRGIYDFSDLDFMIRQASARGRSIILTLGFRQPRWPECHYPAWAVNLSAPQKEELIFKLVEQVVKRYRNEPAIMAWQVENEFFVKWFGDCPVRPRRFLEEEIALVRSLDGRPIVLTDSGELSWWFAAARGADIFGTTMYRKVYAPWGAATWPYPPVYYSRLGKLVRLFTGFDRIIISELQAEPWARTTLVTDSTQINYETFDPGQFAKNIEYAKNSGIDEAYLWGAEWWYYMKEKKGIDAYWEQAKGLWKTE